MSVSFSSGLYRLIIAPLEAIFETVYYLAYTVLPYAGISIVFLSLIMNLLLLPLYRQTDAIQAESIETEKKLKKWVKHIRKTFRGDERFMMLQAYYRENHYKPTDILKGISPLLLEIPFFMAAYHFLSHLTILEGTAFGPIRDLSLPDGLLTFGSFSLNLLPVLMTLINAASTVIYTKGTPVSTKIQLYGMAAVFLVLLYDSPSGLVLYWTLNNLFSLIKNLVVRTKKPGRTVAVLLSVGGWLCALALFAPLRIQSKVTLAILTVLLNLPLAVHLIRRRLPQKSPGREPSRKPEVMSERNGKAVFFSCALFMTVLTGLLIPSAVIHASPDEFIIKGSAVNPLLYVWNSFLIAAGTFLIWGVVFYRLMKPRWKRVTETVCPVLCVSALIDYMAFGRHYGNMSNMLIFDQKITMSFPYMKEILLNLAVLLPVLFLVWYIGRKKTRLIRIACFLCAGAMLVTSSVDLIGSYRVLKPKLSPDQQMDKPENEKIIPISRNGKNVVVLMLDRAISGYLPYIFEEDPQLREQFSGFTYYPNTVSFGGHTNFGLPSLMGGYEYTPIEMNRRDQESLKDKHNEAMKVMPVLFRQAGFDVTVCDPTYAGYGWIPDLSIYQAYPEVHTHITMGNCNGNAEERRKTSVDTLNRNLYFYSLFRTAPVFCQPLVYSQGRYLNANGGMGQVVHSVDKATGFNGEFEDSFNVLKKLSAMTRLTDDGGNTFFVMCNDTTHAPTLLQMPDYGESNRVDNTSADQNGGLCKTANGQTITLHTIRQVTHYHCNMAAYREIGRWLDYLKEEGVYDNTRIILVSDHGYNVNQFAEMMLSRDGFRGSDYERQADAMKYNPLLLVKDFGDHGPLRTDERFMTNAQTPLLATQDLIEHPINPFTHRDMKAFAENSGPVYVTGSIRWNTNVNNGNRYIADIWMTVHDDVRRRDNWSYVEESDLP